MQLSNASDDLPKDTKAGALMVYFNGQLCRANEAAISPFDHGLLTGDGIFETLVAYRGKPFAPEQHYQRLTLSADALGLTIPTEDNLYEMMCEVIRANGLDALPKSRIRITITGGESPLGSTRGDHPPTVVVAASDVPDFKPASDTFVVPFARNDQGALAGLKTINYGENVVALRKARSNGADEAIFGNTRGNLCEGTGSNIFLIKGDGLITPPISAGCLPGITRTTVMECARICGISCQEIDIPLSDLETCEGAFLSSTLREIQPIRSVNGTSLPSPEEFTEPLHRQFRELTGQTS